MNSLPPRLAGVWELPDVLRIVALRGQLMQKPAARLHAGGWQQRRKGGRKCCPPRSNSRPTTAPSLCVVSGPDAEIASFAEFLKGQDIVCRHLHTSHAFHSSMMDPIVEPLRAEVAKVSLRPPTLPLCLDGDRATHYGSRSYRSRLLGTPRPRYRAVFKGGSVAG